VSGATPLYRLTGAEAPPTPVLVVALDGWVDAGLAASTAIESLLESIETMPYAVFDSEELLDQRARRPQLKISDGINQALTWPEVVLRVGTDPLGSGLAVLVGPEPDLRWRSFSTSVAELAIQLGARLMVGFGGFPAGAPHTRPVKLAATASNDLLAQQVGFIGGTIEVPAGVQAVVERACADVGIPSVGLWARVPHYLAAMPFPGAALTLVNGLASISGLVIDSGMLAEASEAARIKVDELIAQSSEHQAMVRQLEQHIDELEGTPVTLDERAVPSGDEIAAELERYLRGEHGGE
jgi:hypothetical protein